jgi:hypothetical protein
MSLSHASIWKRSRHFVPSGRTLASGFEFVGAVAAEFRRAIAAARRYDQLKGQARARGNSAADPSRQVYLEFYSDA